VVDVQLTFVCQAYDEADPLMASTVAWVQRFADHPSVSHLTVLALRTSDTARPSESTEILEIGRANRLATLVAFYRAALRLYVGGVRTFFVYQGGPYPILLAPLRIIGVRVYQWKAHPAVSRAMRVAAWCDDLLFTSTPQALPLETTKIRVVGNAVDTTRFRPRCTTLDLGLVVAARVGPVKHIERAIALLGRLRGEGGVDVGLTVVGPIQDVAYHQELVDLADRLRVAKHVAFVGPVEQARLPDYFNRARVVVNHCAGALNRSVLEAMACGAPIFSVNSGVCEALEGSGLKVRLWADREDLDGEFMRVRALLSLSRKERAELGERLRRVVLSRHDVCSIADRIFKEINDDCSLTRT